jgi:hypothetical protein
LSSAREGRKTYYSYTGASMLGTFVKVLSGKTSKQEVKEWVDLFKSDE